MAHPKTLFHLIPQNEEAFRTLKYEKNKPFVSRNLQGNIGLEVGFHVAPRSAGSYIIARLGRHGDLVLNDVNVSRLHASFEINPETKVVMLCAKRKNAPRMYAHPKGDANEATDGGCVIPFAVSYRIKITVYDFELVWNELPGRKAASVLQSLTLTEYQEALSCMDGCDSVDKDTARDPTEYHKYTVTRIQTAQSPKVHELETSRKFLGKGGYGSVYQSIDLVSGQFIAVKVTEFKEGAADSEERARLHREMKSLQNYPHPNIIEFLGYSGWDSAIVTFYMPMRDGNVMTLAKTTKYPNNVLCREILHQMLQALDFLASHKQCHRDIKPENILYAELGEMQYHFQLADFGLARHSADATSFVGTLSFEAPEIYNHALQQSPKMDIWSLFITMLWIYAPIPWPPKKWREYETGLLPAVRQAVVSSLPELHFMAREDPTYRASAAQCLQHLFKGAGLTTKGPIPPIEQLPVPLKSRANGDQTLDNAVSTLSNPNPVVGEAPVARPVRQARENHPYGRPNPHRLQVLPDAQRQPVLFKPAVATGRVQKRQGALAKKNANARALQRNVQMFMPLEPTVEHTQAPEPTQAPENRAPVNEKPSMLFQIPGAFPQTADFNR